MQTVKAALEDALGCVDRVDAHVLVAHVLDVNRAWIAANPMHVLTETQDARIDTLVAQRALGHPVAYLLGRREFYGRDFVVSPDVLIPRPETETLVDAAVSVLRGGSKPETRGTRKKDGGRGEKQEQAVQDVEAGDLRVLDLGTGSGAIAVTLACEGREWRIVATDSSGAALEVARANARAHGCEESIRFARGSWYEAVAGERFALIVANPPYIAAGDAHLGQGDLRFEPACALSDGSADGLGSIRAIVAGAAAHLAPGGTLLFEHGYDQARAATRLLEDAGFGDLVALPDLAGIPRVAGGRKMA